MSSEPYELDDPHAYQWTKAAYDMLVAGTLQASVTVREGIEAAIVTGPCPRCGDHFTFNQIRTAITSGVGTLGGDNDIHAVDPYKEIDVRCECKGPHDGRPEETKTGCGVAYKLRVRATDG